jgi:hypothetical protein
MAEPRSGSRRRADALAKLREFEADVWVATASADGREHLVPLSYAWDETNVILAVEPGSVTSRNVMASGRARLGFGPTRDVLIVDTVLASSVEVSRTPVQLAELYARQSDWDPRLESSPYLFLLLRPMRVQAWREANELAGKTIMRDGVWLY